MIRDFTILMIITACFTGGILLKAYLNDKNKK